MKIKDVPTGSYFAYEISNGKDWDSLFFKNEYSEISFIGNKNCPLVYKPYKLEYMNDNVVPISRKLADEAIATMTARADNLVDMASIGVGKKFIFNRTVYTKCSSQGLTGCIGVDEKFNAVYLYGNDKVEKL